MVDLVLLIAWRRLEGRVTAQIFFVTITLDSGHSALDLAKRIDKRSQTHTLTATSLYHNM